MLSDRGSQFRLLCSTVRAEYQYLMRRLGIELIYGKRPRTKGKIENQFRFVRRDFVLENLHHIFLEELNAAWEQWMERYDRKHRHKGLNGDSPADHYVKSQRRSSAEELELLLITPVKVKRAEASSRGLVFLVQNK